MKEIYDATTEREKVKIRVLYTVTVYLS